MKKFRMIMCLALAVLLVNPIFAVSAADNNYNEQVIDDLFEGLNDTDKVLEMPEGGFLFGKAEIYDAGRFSSCFLLPLSYAWRSFYYSSIL